MGVEEALAALRGSGAAEVVDASDAGTLDPGAVDWPRKLLTQVASRTDEELGKDALLIGLYREKGWSLGRIARKLGLDVLEVRQILRVARQRSLAPTAVAAARAEVEGMLDLVTDNVRGLLKAKDRETTLAVARGTGVLTSEHAGAAGQMTLQVTFVQQVEAAPASGGDGPVVSVQTATRPSPLGLTGVVGAPNSTREAFEAQQAPAPTPATDQDGLE